MEILLHIKMNLHMSTWPHMHHYLVVMTKESRALLPSI